MKKIFLLILSILVILFPCYSQCKCEKIDTEGVNKSYHCQTLPIASDNSTQVGITVASDYEQHYLALTIRFRYSALDLVSGLSIRLQNNKVIELDLAKSGISYIENSQVVQGVFTLTENSISELSVSGIKTISFNLSDNITHIYESKTNSNVLINQIKCLPKLSVSKSTSLDEKNGFQDFKLGMSIEKFPNFPIVKKNNIENNLLEYYELDEPNLDILDNKIDYISFYCVDKIIIKIYVKVHYDKNNEIYELLKETFGTPNEYKNIDKKVKDALSFSESEIKGKEVKWKGTKLILQYKDLQSNSEASSVIAKTKNWSTRNISLEYKISSYDDILQELKTKRIKKSTGKL